MNNDSGDGDDEDFFIFNSEDIDSDSDEDLIIDNGLKERIAEEAFFLSSDRLYIIFDPISIDKVSVRAYDCSNKEDVTAAHILQQGMLSLLESDYDYLMQLGHEATLERIEERAQESKRKMSIEEVYDNVIKVKFSEDN